MILSFKMPPLPFYPTCWVLHCILASLVVLVEILHFPGAQAFRYSLWASLAHRWLSLVLESITRLVEWLVAFLYHVVPRSRPRVGRSKRTPVSVDVCLGTQILREFQRDAKNNLKKLSRLLCHCKNTRWRWYAWRFFDSLDKYQLTACVCMLRGF